MLNVCGAGCGSGLAFKMYGIIGLVPINGEALV